MHQETEAIPQSGHHNGSTPKTSNATLQKTIYHGPVIQSKSLNELDFNLEGSIGVDENGKIAFVSRDQTTPSDDEWRDAKQIRLGKNEFFFPGFIGTNDKRKNIDLKHK